MFLLFLIFEIGSLLMSGAMALGGIFAIFTGDATDLVVVAIFIGIIVFAVSLSVVLHEDKYKRDDGEFNTVYKVSFFVRIILLSMAWYMTFAEPSYNNYDDKYNDDKYDEWLEENYGDGKMQDINDAIEGYKNDH